MSGKSASDLAKNLELASRALQMYPETHPRARVVIDQAYETIQDLLSDKDTIIMSVAEGNLLVEGQVVERGNLVVDRFAKDLFERNIQSLSFYRGVKPEEMVFFLRHLITKPQRIRDMGGFEKILTDQGIQAIQVNKIKYGIISDEVAAGAPGGIDQGTLSELLYVMQSVASGIGSTSAAADNLEKSLETGKTEDPGGILLRIFQMIAQKTPETPDSPENESLKQRFAQLYRSFTPAMQAKLLMSALVKGNEEKGSPADFYRELTPEELEASIMQLLDQPIPQQQLSDVASKLQELQKEEQITLSEKVTQKMEEKGLIERETPPPPVISDEMLKKEGLAAEDIPKVPEALSELIGKGNLQEADQLSKKVFGYLGNGQPDQKISAIKTLPEVISALSKNEKWKNVQFSLSFLVATCYRKEANPDVALVYIPLLLSMFRKNYEAKNMNGCRDTLNTIRAQVDRHESVLNEFADQWSIFAAVFVDHLRDGWSGVETLIEGFKMAGQKGASFLTELLAEEEDQSVRSRLIQYITALKQEVLLEELDRRMSDPRWYVARNMVTIIGKMNPPELPAFLQKGVLHPDARVAKEVVKLLYRSTSRSEQLLLPLMEHTDRGVRLQSIHLVTMNPFPGAVPALIRLALAGPVADTDLRAAALQALLKIRTTDALAPATTVLERKPVTKSEIPERNAAVRILGEIAREQTRPVLEKIAQSDPHPETRNLASSYL